jgi:hypothetical protein
MGLEEKIGKNSSYFLRLGGFGCIEDRTYSNSDVLRIPLIRRFYDRAFCDSDFL